MNLIKTFAIPTCVFVRDKILSVADYNSTRVGVVIVIVVYFFTEHYQVEILTICFESEFGGQIQPYSPTSQQAKNFKMGQFSSIEFKFVTVKTSNSNYPYLSGSSGCKLTTLK